MNQNILKEVYERPKMAKKKLPPWMQPKGQDQNGQDDGSGDDNARKKAIKGRLAKMKASKGQDKKEKADK